MKKLPIAFLALATTAVVFFLAISVFVSPAASNDKKADTRPQKPAAVVVEYFCCDADGACLPANNNSVCPGGFTKVVNKTCEKGERGCDL